MTPSRRSALVFASALGAALAVAAPAASQPGVAPKPAITAAPNPAERGETVTFNGAGSTGDGQGSTLTKYEWDLDGDGVFERDTGTTATASRAYVDPGIVTARVRVTDNEADIAEASTSVRINAPPNAGFIYQPSPPVAGKRVVFSSTSSDPDGQLPTTAYAWDFDGDREFDDAFGETVTVSFAKPGKQKVRLLVTDADGASTQAARKVSVSAEGSKLRLMKPFPTVRLSGAITGGGGTEVDLLVVRGPKGAKAIVNCAGRACPFDRRRRIIKKGRVEFPELERQFRPGTVIEVRVTQPRRIGKFTRFKFRDGRVPKREDRCVNPGRRKPVDCPRS